LSDEPITDPAADYFGFAAFATALGEIIDNESTDTPLTIALSAPWGAGKTSVARMIQDLLGSW
jgi:predicted KAP-like P-loop ATPase